MSTTTTFVHSLTETILGKRKHQWDSLALPSTTSSPTNPSQRLILINGTLVPPTKKRYACTFRGCSKSYSKPSRLTEHQRSHTGQRPFVCETCHKSYLRQSHLQAHVRSHLSNSDRPFVCSREGCEKRFWTSQHLRVHVDWHNGSRAFHCSEPGCTEAFAKHNRLRAHICEAHSPPGSKPYQCEHDGCTKSFSTAQHLHTHQKTHDERRYTCVHAACLPKTGSEPTYFQKWTSLQHHIRTVHQPKCIHPSCNGRVFSSQKGLSAHVKLHEQRELEETMERAIASGSDPTVNDDESPSPKRRRGGEIGRDWECDAEGCEKCFKSKKALVTHVNVTHLGRRDFICSEHGCQKAFGYKHLLQRHMAKVHPRPPRPISSDEDAEFTDNDRAKEPVLFDIDLITGKTYAQEARTKLLCPYPHLGDFPVESAQENLVLPTPKQTCEFAFRRAYDLRRHLKAVHGFDINKECVDQWVRRKKAAGSAQGSAE